MAVLSDALRAELSAEFQREAANIVNTGNVTKADIRAAVNAGDQWADDNAAPYNAALPAAFRTQASNKQKTLLLVYIILKRAGLL